MVFGPILNVLNSVARAKICVDFAHKQRIRNKLAWDVYPLL